MAAPLQLGGDIVGFLGVDNPRANTNTLLVLQAVSSFVVNQLGKQREEQQQMMLSALTDDYDVLIRSDIDRDTFAVLRTNDSYLVTIMRQDQVLNIAHMLVVFDFDLAISVAVMADVGDIGYQAARIIQRAEQGI